jgi:hypothetical protein
MYLFDFHGNFLKKPLEQSYQQTRSQKFSKGGARQQRGYIILKIIFFRSYPLRTFFLEEECTSTLFTPPGYGSGCQIFQKNSRF